MYKILQRDHWSCENDKTNDLTLHYTNTTYIYFGQTRGNVNADKSVILGVFLI